MATDRLSELLWNYLRVPGLPDSFVLWGPGSARHESPAVEIVVQGGPPALTPPAGPGTSGDAGMPIVRSVPEAAVPAASPQFSGPPVSIPDLSSGLDAALPSSQAAATAPMMSGAGGIASGGGAVAAGASFTKASAHAHDLKAQQGPVLPELSQLVESGASRQSNEVVMEVLAADALPGAGTIPAFDVGNLLENAADRFGGEAPAGVALTWQGDTFREFASWQTNLLADQDMSFSGLPTTLHGAWAGAGLTTFQSISSGGNVSANASTIAETGDGFHAIFVTGNFYEFNSIIQYNVTLDDDWNVGLSRMSIGWQAGGGQFAGSQSVTSGGNVQSNWAAIVDEYGVGIQLVGGRSAEFFLVEQQNLLVDGDVTSLLGLFQGGPGASSLVVGSAMTATVGANMQSNFGAFLTGAVASGEIDAGWLAFAQSLAGGGAFDPEALGELAGGDPLRILFVQGDYYLYRTVVQVNFQFDEDVNVAELASRAEEHGGVYKLMYDQFIASGQNEASNYALIIDENGGYHLQVVGGDYIETNSIQQYNILYDADHAVVAASSAPGDGDLGFDFPDPVIPVHDPHVADALRAASG